MEPSNLEERVRQLEYDNERLRAAHSIQNMVNRYEYMLPAGLYEEVVSMFSTRPDVSVELGNWGVYEGPESIKRLYFGWHKVFQGDRVSGMNPGIFSFGPNSNPVIEIAADGQTAKGLWVSAGPGVVPADGKLTGFWMFTKRAYDFVREDGEWKIWHYHVYNFLVCPFDKCWTEMEDPDAVIGKPDFPPELGPDKPATYHWTWSPTARVEYVPAAPVPYETFDPSGRY